MSKTYGVSLSVAAGFDTNHDVVGNSFPLFYQVPHNGLDKVLYGSDYDVLGCRTGREVCPKWTSIFSKKGIRGK